MAIVYATGPSTSAFVCRAPFTKVDAAFCAAVGETSLTPACLAMAIANAPGNTLEMEAGLYGGDCPASGIRFPRRTFALTVAGGGTALIDCGGVGECWAWRGPDDV